MRDSAPDLRATMRAALRDLARDERGAALTEYLILVGVVALLALHAFSVFGADASTVIRNEGADLALLGL
jgi:Flp pilus assembly pilin Flp